MKLSSTHIRYLLTLYQLAGTQGGVSSIEVAACLGVKKAAVSRMMPLLVEKGLVVKQKYSKLYLTDIGLATASRLTEQVNAVAGLMQARMELSCEAAWKAACAAICELPLEEN